MKDSVITFDDGLSHYEFLINRNYNITFNLLNGSSLILKELYTNDCNNLLNVNLNSEHSCFNATYLAISNKDLINVKQVVNHKSKYTKSDLKNYAFCNLGSVNFNTESSIFKGFKKSEARQLTKGIIVSEESIISSKPILNIYENDVLASHGCAIGKIREEELFYLMSRGLSRKDAIILITRGIIEPFFNGLNDEELKNSVYLKLEGSSNV